MLVERAGPRSVHWLPAETAMAEDSRSVSRSRRFQKWIPLLTPRIRRLIHALEGRAPTREADVAHLRLQNNAL